MEAELASLVENLSHAIDLEIEKMMEGVPAELKEILTYYHKLGGKRFRPLLMYLTCGATGGNPEDTIPCAASYELLHTFSLYHDDIIDRAELRRGAPSVYKKWGEETTIIAGDILHALIHAHLIRAGLEGKYSPEIASRLLVEVVYGAELPTGWAAIKEMELAKSDKIPDIDTVVWVTKTKTAPILELSAWAGGLIAGADENILRYLREFGDKIGFAYQLVDDLLDVVGTSIGDKPRGGDFRENKKTLIYTLAEQRNPGVMKKYSGRELTSQEMDEFVREHPEILEEIKEKVSQLLEEAKNALEVLPESKFKHGLLSLVEMIKSRTY